MITENPNGSRLTFLLDKNFHKSEGDNGTAINANIQCGQKYLDKSNLELREK